MKLHGKVALITGASQGIGNAISLSFAEHGAKIVINYLGHHKEALNLKEAIESKGSEAYLIRADISKPDEALSMVDQIIKKYKKIDVLVNNASVYLREGFFDCSEELFDKVIDTNLKSAFFCSQFAGKQMVKQKRGIIINISSNAAFMPKKGHGIVYGLSKTAIIYLTQSTALTLAPYVRVNCIAPGFTKTQMLPFIKSADELRKLSAKIPLKRINLPEDIANVVLFLASDDSRNITGQTLMVDGGFILK
ncbi:MAG: 3-oxoacyl-ACP reductase FabG [Candidatus Abyssobacteria bacterium SURF_5]|jgi:3-oxoacyl-[acyl-carrier protein] reductase|uniref:3-oxoacyl-ACP reductase FabG n=1 Tax=Abyssobacteria bacterium (strain SURF_5) TaxID=2093360 RepID=A0A3A4NTL9_ABYX5|nr:MAG: 3-oxoacyl-ACP reductase FabG [Candidatus Abyssubacteria bacterium SURF_5]